MRITIEEAGNAAGRPVAAITLANRSGTSVRVLTYGCIIQSLKTPDRHGVAADVTLGFADLDTYLKGHPFFGAIAGRVANRIADGRFTLGGKTYALECNEAATGHHLHGGARGFDKQVWGYDLEERGDAAVLHLHRTSPDGEGGYPGRLDVIHSIGLDEEGTLTLDFRAAADADTIVNLVNHNYYNLSGVEGATIEDHVLMLAADFVLPVDDRTLPTGEVAAVAGTPFDFRAGAVVGEAMAKRDKRDFDHAFVLGTAGADGYRRCAELRHPASGRVMRVTTTQPSVQFYNGIKLANREWFGRAGRRYPAAAGLCLETQRFPDAPNRPQFPSIVLPAGQLYRESTRHQFSVMA
jgi:aldose 1-epimerase